MSERGGTSGVIASTCEKTTGKIASIGTIQQLRHHFDISPFSVLKM